ncbi:hypothetical protein FALBO_14242 [Fusarium albosuccineum]|uniref:Uncharacterized protein n=1 Tax=Fusarium albosuccineum TaxID=1237068 RepID=A0A8H4KWZ0_9HYPO|nr:hypothetical protein FALBO_14242 [Fusarium albosuccineum]
MSDPSPADLDQLLPVDEKSLLIADEESPPPDDLGNSPSIFQERSLTVEETFEQFKSTIVQKKKKLGLLPKEKPYLEAPVLPGATKDPLPYTGTPWKLFLGDVGLFFRKFRFLPGIFLPLWPSPSGYLGELYPSPANIVDVAFHTFLSITQLGFIFSLFTLTFLPTWLYLGYIISFFAVNELICLHFNKWIPSDGLKSTEDKYSLMWAPHNDESWIFLNGICVGGNWLQNNIDRISRSFHRPVVGVHNRTAGVIFDLVQCLIQRAFNYATQDVRECYVLVKKALLDPKKTKVVLILHSQGGIEGGMILDWLLDELPHEILKKLEIYTFGCMANHFSNPVRGVDPKTGKNVGVIQHIEHYANEKDFACQFGVLNFTRHKKRQGFKNRFMGQVFVNRRAGHQLNQHYLDGMFPLDESLHRTREAQPGDFMDIRVHIKEGAGLPPKQVTRAELPPGLDITKGSKKHKVVVDNHNVPKIKDLSRLWSYRNGESPVS